MTDRRRPPPRPRPAPDPAADLQMIPLSDQPDLDTALVARSVASRELPRGESRPPDPTLRIRGPVVADDPPAPSASASDPRPSPSPPTTLLLGLLAILGGGFLLAVSFAVYTALSRMPAAPAPAPVVQTVPEPAPSPSPPPAPVARAAPVTVVLPAAGARFSEVEIVCAASGFRRRVPFQGGRATLAQVPPGRCVGHLKGGSPVSFPARAGATVTCTGPGPSCR